MLGMKETKLPTNTYILYDLYCIKVKSCLLKRSYIQYKRECFKKYNLKKEWIIMVCNRHVTPSKITTNVRAKYI